MTIEEEMSYLYAVGDTFNGMHAMLNRIEENIAKHPGLTQIKFIQSLNHIIVEAYLDTTNPNDNFLNQTSDNLILV